MIQVFDEVPNGIQQAPHDCRITAAGYQVALREVDLTVVRDKEALMMAFLSGLALTQSFGRNWDALYDVLTDPEQFSGRLAVVLYDYTHFKKKNAKLCAEMDGVLLDAQKAAAEEGRLLWLLAQERESAGR
ncbi:hypothetical protein Dxin01_01088 [Deinococcus xinjiangensis]|uniref:Barstar (barnase inhibitor) domain-containing protein n=1 Tax=Deinococcus xinjiangensis TaxID=457454 RepID=A0ABP9V9J4_9DEIO